MRILSFTETTMLRRTILGALLAIASVFALALAPFHVVHQSSAAVERLALRPPVQLPAVRAAIVPSHSAPHRAPRFTDGLGLLAVAGATKKRASRRTSGKKRDVPMYLDSDVHVLRESEDPTHNGKLVTTVIKGGVMVDDTDLTDDEIDELTARRVIRPATPEEIDRLEQADTAEARAELVATQEAELAQLRANNEAARAEMAARENVSGDALAKLDQKNAMTVAALQEKHAGALAKFDAQ
jgi:hypothetical protein